MKTKDQVRYQTWDGTAVDVGDYVQEIGGRWYLAVWSKRQAQWIGSLRPEIKRASGCSGWFCSHEWSIPGAGGYSCARRADAVRRAVQVYGLEVLP